jgi:N-carbamoylputrescine amidase
MTDAADSWRFELQAAAYANGCWIAGVNRVGRDEGGAPRDWPGRSMLVNPRGEVVEEASRTDNDLIVADVDLEEVATARAQQGFFRDRRPEIYGGLVEKG